MKKLLLIFFCFSVMQLNGGIKRCITDLAKKRKKSQMRVRQQKREKNERAKKEMLEKMEQEECNGRYCKESCVYTIWRTFFDFVIYEPTNPECEKEVRVLNWN